MEFPAIVWLAFAAGSASTVVVVAGSMVIGDAIGRILYPSLPQFRPAARRMYGRTAPGYLTEDQYRRTRELWRRMERVLAFTPELREATRPDWTHDNRVGGKGNRSLNLVRHWPAAAAGVMGSNPIGSPD